MCVSSFDATSKMESKSSQRVRSKFISNKRKRFTELAKLRTSKRQPTAGVTAESVHSPPTEAAESVIGESSSQIENTPTSLPMVSNLSPMESVNESPGREGDSLSPEIVHLEQSTSEPESLVEPQFPMSVDREPSITEELSSECWSVGEASITEESSSECLSEREPSITEEASSESRSDADYIDIPPILPGPLFLSIYCMSG